MVLRGLIRSLVAVGLTIPLFATTVEVVRARDCAGALRFSIGEQTIDVDAGVTTFESPSGLLTLVDPPSCWSAPIIVGEQRTQVRVHKARVVHGSIAKLDRDLPSAIRIAFRPPGISDGTLISEEARIDDRNFAVRLPAEPLDLRIEAAQFAPVYLWQFDADTIALKLVAGASVSGWVTTPRKTDLASVTVRLVPATATWESPESEARKLQTRSVRANEQGFFQIAGVEEGTWNVVAEAAQLSSTKPFEIELREGKEVALRSPLELRSKGSLSVSITPSANFDGSPWKVELQRRVPLSRYTRVITTETASLAGQWTKEGLENGTYVVNVIGARGETMKREEVELATDAAHVNVHIDAVAIRGTVTLGDDPFPVTLKWITLRGESLAMQTNDEGFFEGVLPKEGTWYVEARSGKTEYLSRKRVDVEARDDGESTVVDIAIPAGRVRGKVVDRDGRPAKGIAFLEGPLTMRDAEVADDGTFEFGGLGEGVHTLRAENETSMSPSVSVSVSESSVAEVTLVVDARRRVEGWLTTSAGAPLAGAQIWYWTPQSPRAPEQSGPSGQFTLVLPASTTTVHLAIVTPSRPAKLITLPLPPKGERLHVSVSSERAILRLLIGSTPPYPFVFSRDGAATTLLSLLRMPPGGSWPEWLDESGAISAVLEPGIYDFCDSMQRNRCVVAQANAGMTTNVDLTQLWSAKWDGPRSRP